MRNLKSIKIVFNLLTMIGLLGTAAICIYGYRAGIFTSFDLLRGFILQTGIWGSVVFILIQIIQVVLPILPGGISCAYGVLLFGAAYGFLYNYVGIVIGSVIAFLLSRRFGKPFIQSVTSERTYQKYIGWLDRGSWFEKLFALGIFLPGAPDDLLCMLAGVTEMKLMKFIMILIFCKPGALFLYSMGLSEAMGWIIWR